MNSTIGGNLRYLRRRSGRTRAEMAKRAGASQAWVCRIARALDVEVMDLLQRRPEQTRDWALSRRGLTLAQRLVLLALVEYADERGEQCLAPLGLLKRITEFSRRGITKALGGPDGTLIERARGEPGRATHYRLLLSAQKDQGCQESGTPVPGRGQETGVSGNPVHSAGEPSALSGGGNSVPIGREHSAHG
jgi:transcriptional regulator with XRE-family HTH domain